MQGSPTGPYHWNLIQDELLNLPRPGHVFLQAYADDTLVIACGAKPEVACERAQIMLKSLEQAAYKYSLTFNASKTQTIMLGRGAELETRPTILFNDHPLTYSNTIKYLGIMIDRHLYFYDHITYITNKARQAIFGFTRISGNNFGPPQRTLRLYWNAAIEPAITYGSAIWHQQATKEKNIFKLRQIQRYANIAITRAYRTISHEAVQVLAGTMPLIHRIQQLAAHYFLTRPPDLHLFIQKPLLLNHPLTDDFKQEIRTILIANWQHTWNESTKGRHTFKYFPSISDRLEYMHLPFNHDTTQFFSGHGDFKTYLHRFNLTADSSCFNCNVAESVDHIVNSCPLYIIPRTELYTSLLPDDPPDDLLTLYTTAFKELFTYLGKIMTIRKNHHLERRRT